MNANELSQKKQELIDFGLSHYADLVKIVDTLGKDTMIGTRDGFKLLDLTINGITLIHAHRILRAETRGHDQMFVRWLYRDYLMVTVGEYLVIGKHTELFRKDRVALLYLVNDECRADKEEIENQIFVPYHKNWFVETMNLIARANEILGNASMKESMLDADKLAKQLFLDSHPEYQEELNKFKGE